MKTKKKLSAILALGVLLTVSAGVSAYTYYDYTYVGGALFRANDDDVEAIVEYSFQGAIQNTSTTERAEVHAPVPRVRPDSDKLKANIKVYQGHSGGSSGDDDECTRCTLVAKADGESVASDSDYDCGTGNKSMQVELSGTDLDFEASANLFCEIATKDGAVTSKIYTVIFTEYWD